jgi:hypothetical protein
MQVPTALIECQVRRVAFDYQTLLLLLGQRPDGSRRIEADLVIETSFVMHDAAGQCHELDPGTSRSALAPVIDLFLRTITAVTVIDRGTLTLDFDNGAQLVVSPHPQYESWELQGEGISAILVGPGGRPPAGGRTTPPGAGSAELAESIPGDRAEHTTPSPARPFRGHG